MYQLHRIFCATPWELERERTRFYDLVGTFNETAAMPKGVLFAAVTLGNIRDKRPIQYAIDENIQDCRYYIQVLLNDWGPAERNFRNDYHLALQSINQPTLPMDGVALIAKRQPSGATLAEGVPAPQTFFANMEEFDASVNGLMAGWLASTAK